MAAVFTPEDGSGLPNANAYLALADVTQYHEDRGNDFWVSGTGVTDAKRQTAIVRATSYIDKRFGRKFKGQRQNLDQALAWPRIGAFDDDGFQFPDIPTQLKQAVSEYALRALIYQTLAPDPLRPVPSQDMTTGTQETEVITGQVKSKRVQVGPISESTTYESAQDVLARNISAGTRSVQSSIMNDFNIPEYPEADLLIEELLESNGPLGITLSRGD